MNKDEFLDVMDVLKKEEFLKMTRDLTHLAFVSNNDPVRKMVLTRSRTLTSVLDNVLLPGYVYKMNNGTLTDLLKLAVDIDLSQDTYGSDILPIVVIDDSSRFIADLLRDNENIESTKHFDEFTVVYFKICAYPIIFALNNRSLPLIIESIVEGLDLDESPNLCLLFENMDYDMYLDSKTIYPDNDIITVVLDDHHEVSYDVKAILLGHTFDIKED